ncbi:MAG: FAD-dependent oxidoreductase [Acidobacteriota bacterium]
MLPVAIIGGGPVGLFLASCLNRFGVECRVLEQRRTVSNHSRSIGIHPVSLDLFARLGLSAALLSRGVRVVKGVAYDERGKLGELSLQTCDRRFPFVLILPQSETESVLEAHLLLSGRAGALCRESQVVGLNDQGEHVEIECLEPRGRRSLIQAQFAVGCDGKRSVVRRSAGIPFPGRPYRDQFIMGDFDDNTCFGSDAAIFLHSCGLVESFPLPFRKRRWVVREGDDIREMEMGPPTRQEVELLLRARIGHELQTCRNYMVSRFRAERFLASALYRGRIVLAGDCAHVVSPIGGQGLNLGWLGAWRLAERLRDVVHRGMDYQEAFGRYSREQRSAARRATHRAELNMTLGRTRTRSVFLRNSMVRLLLQSPINRLTARLFTMHGLYSWPV